jgi:ATP-dependent protease ClpP protease subunit
MARNDPPVPLPACLARARISLIGDFGAGMAEKLNGGLNDAPDDEDVAIEVTTIGGEAEIARRMVLDIQRARQRRSGRLLFLGKSAVYSAGVTFMSAFDRSDRFLTPDTILLIHERQLSETIELAGPLRTSLILLQAKQAEVENGLRLEQENFRRLVDGSDLDLEEVDRRAPTGWYLSACEAVDRGLVQALA